MQGLQGKRAFPASTTTTRIERRGTGGGRPGLGWIFNTVPNVMQWKEKGWGWIFVCSKFPTPSSPGLGWGGTTYLRDRSEQPPRGLSNNDKTEWEKIRRSPPVQCQTASCQTPRSSAAAAAKAGQRTPPPFPSPPRDGTVALHSRRVDGLNTRCDTTERSSAPACCSHHPMAPLFLFSKYGGCGACVRAAGGTGVVSVCGWGSSVINEREGVSSPPLTAAGDGWRAVCRGRRTPRRGDRVQACFCRSSSARQADGFYPFQVWLLSSSNGRGRVCMHKFPPQIRGIPGIPSLCHAMQ